MINRQQAGSIAAGAAVLVALVMHEGWRDKPYTPVAGDVATIGYGRTEGVISGQKADPVRELAWVGTKIEKDSATLKKCIGEDTLLYQREFDALLSLSYNVGAGAVCRSSIPKKLKAGKYVEACNTILSFNKFNGRPLAGLINRRQKERLKCLGLTDIH